MSNQPRFYVLLFGDDPIMPAKIVRKDSEPAAAGYAKRASMADDVSRVEIVRVVATVRSKQSSGLTMLGETTTAAGAGNTSGGQ